MGFHIGWIDFSKDERDKALELLRLFQEQGAVDEIGIGIVRDAFADLFFPGTSTFLTRAKYFVVVPYIIQEKIEEGGSFGDRPCKSFCTVSYGDPVSNEGRS